VYYTLNITYRLVLNPEQKKTFEGIVKYCDEHSNLIPLSFVLGFYVSIVMTRWWSQYTVSRIIQHKLCLFQQPFLFVVHPLARSHRRFRVGNRAWTGRAGKDLKTIAISCPPIFLLRHDKFLFDEVL
jgi:Bestrophin, RFP-TM, chloride channel